MLKVSLFASLLFGLLPLASAQAQDSIESKAAAANEAFQAKDWAKAEPLYEQLTESQPENGRNWYRLGASLQATGKHEKAAQALDKAKAKGAPPTAVEYSLGGVYASMGQTDQALQHLAEAVKQGYSQPDQMVADADLQSVRSDPRFPALLVQAKHNQKPCAYTPENRQFDFWLGDWNVVTTNDGVAAGLSHIESTIGDCVIWENWTSLGGSGYTGKSYNTYDVSLKRWEQFWVDNVGGMVFFFGGLKDGVMDYFTDDIPQPDGTKARRHLQFFNLGPDKVRQFSQVSADGGKTWNVEYDLTYNRKKS